MGNHDVTRLANYQEVLKLDQALCLSGDTRPRYFDLPLDVLLDDPQGATSRLCNSLRQAGARTLGDMRFFSISFLYRVHGFGDKARQDMMRLNDETGILLYEDLVGPADTVYEKVSKADFYWANPDNPRVPPTEEEVTKQFVQNMERLLVEHADKPTALDYRPLSTREVEALENAGITASTVLILERKKPLHDDPNVA